MSEKKTEQTFNNINDVFWFIQKNLKAPKSQYNKFGGYNYRNCEDIQQGIKDIAPEGACVYVTDDIVQVANRIYVKATATLSFGDKTIQNTAYAREPESQKGMNDSQVTGSASSYARKYALGGLFMVDDQKDADSQDNKADAVPKKNQAVKQNTAPELTPAQQWIKQSVLAIKGFQTKEEVTNWFKDNVSGLSALSDKQQAYLEKVAGEHKDTLNA